MRILYTAVAAGLLTVAAAAAADAPTTAPTSAPATAPDLAPGRPLAADAAEPSLVTLDLVDAPLQDVLDELQRQSGITLTIPSSGEVTAAPKVTVSADRQPLWKVLTDVCDQARADCEPAQKNGIQITLQKTTRVHPVRWASGPVLLEPSGIQHVHDLTAADSDFCALTLRGMWEPRLNVLFYTSAGLPDKAEDENGLSLVPPAGAALEYPRQRISEWDPPDYVTFQQADSASALSYKLRINAPPNVGRRIARLNATLKLWLAVKYQKFEVVDLKEATKKAKTMTLGNGMDVGIRNSVYDSGEQTVAVGVFRNGKPPEQWRAQQRLIQVCKVWLIDSSGASTASFSHGASWSPRERWANFSVGKAGAVRAIAEIPVEVREVDLPFEFKDLPLP